MKRSFTKRLFARLPMIGLMLGVVALASDIMAKTTPLETSPSVVIHDTLVSSCVHGYLALMK